ncbi:uncharacterized protein N7487_010679 [Penicillium crustosum]|uniref:uncharacterized protein n=1 Tax=Penicillium crustosum TaxID=36656 RepID=UPI0023947071|nr:uncharacterized protein N7487_009075 [Penicillium crustosum]XP_056726989.1 uncharacterized protein N7487_010679 [Penicillium crustosum]KAJ5394772.1 hypothetical protein N7487_009075 [Penicillium crustosum]KAJ5396376.1 hypothetical protein N7487_010679 [Penicillium crustosum]
MDSRIYSDYNIQKESTSSFAYNLSDYNIQKDEVDLDNIQKESISSFAYNLSDYKIQKESTSSLAYAATYR